MPGIFTPPVTFSSSASIAFSACSRAELIAATTPSSASSMPSLLRNSGSISMRRDLAGVGDGRLDLVADGRGDDLLVAELLLRLLDLALHARRLAHQLVHSAAELHRRLRTPAWRGSLTSFSSAAEDRLPAGRADVSQLRRRAPSHLHQRVRFAASRSAPRSRRLAATASRRASKIERAVVARRSARAPRA